MSVAVNNNLQNLLADRARAKDRSESASSRGELSNRKPRDLASHAHSDKTPSVKKQTHNNHSAPVRKEQTKIEKSEKQNENFDVDAAEFEAAQFEDVLNDQIENGDLYALAASAEGASLLGEESKGTKVEGIALPKTEGKVQPETKVLNPEQIVVDPKAQISKEDALLLAGAGTYAVKNAEAPKVAAEGKMVQAQLGEGENVINMMNAKKAIRPQGNPYAKEMPKNMFTNLNKEVKQVKGKADAIMAANPELATLKKADLLGDMNKAVNALSKMDGEGALRNTKADVKVLDLSKIQAGNKAELINNITDYIVQNASASKNKVEMAVHHDDLGRISITAMKAAPGQVNVEIQTMSPEAHKFFTQNQSDLITHLGTQGVTVADFKLENTSSSSNSSANQDNSGQQFSSNQQGQNQAEDNNRRDESRRRDDLWNLLRKDVA